MACIAKYSGVSASVIRRLPCYYRHLTDLLERGVERISSHEFANLMGFTASQVRQDLNCFGGFGQQGYGYNVETLRFEVGRILGITNLYPAILLGAGNLGMALATHLDFAKFGFQLDAIFDSSPDKISMRVADWTVRDICFLKEYCAENKPVAAILCIPRQAAADLTDSLVEYGIRGFWNFSHYDMSLRHSGRAAVENVHLGDSLMTLGFNIGELLDK